MEIEPLDGSAYRLDTGELIEVVEIGADRGKRGKRSPLGKGADRSSLPPAGNA